MDLSNYVTVLPIVVICYLVGVVCVTFDRIPNKAIPCIVGIVGGLISIPAMYIMPNFPANDVITAISVGIMSGLTSTGVNQVYKQLSKEV